MTKNESMQAMRAALQRVRSIKIEANDIRTTEAERQVLLLSLLYAKRALKQSRTMYLTSK